VPAACCLLALPAGSPAACLLALLLPAGAPAACCLPAGAPAGAACWRCLLALPAPAACLLCPSRSLPRMAAHPDTSSTSATASDGERRRAPAPRDASRRRLPLDSPFTPRFDLIIAIGRSCATASAEPAIGTGGRAARAGTIAWCHPHQITVVALSVFARCTIPTARTVY